MVKGTIDNMLRQDVLAETTTKNIESSQNHFINIEVTVEEKG